MTNSLVSLQATLYQSRNPTRRYLHNSRRIWLENAIKRYSNKENSALEIGPGSGVYVPTLLSAHEHVYLADCEQAYLNDIRSHYATEPRLTIAIDDITQSRLPTKHFDLILCSEVIEHIVDSQSALSNIARLLKPDGVLVLSTPQRHSTLELTAKLALSPALIWLTRLLYREPVLELGHINLMTEKQLKMQLSNANLTVVEQYKSGLYLPGIAELCGSIGQALAANCERLIRDTACDGLLWTQYYILRCAG